MTCSLIPEIYRNEKITIKIAMQEKLLHLLAWQGFPHFLRGKVLFPLAARKAAHSNIPLISSAMPSSYPP
jgi:hypothetical protein